MIELLPRTILQQRHYNYIPQAMSFLGAIWALALRPLGVGYVTDLD
jgi:hypothetical protein